MELSSHRDMGTALPTRTDIWQSVKCQGNMKSSIAFSITRIDLGLCIIW